MPASRTEDTSTDVVRWAAFSCVLVPVVLLWYGASLGGATGTALGLAAVTAVCRLLLRRSERYAARPADPEVRADPEPPAHRGRHQRTGTGTHRGGRHSAPPAHTERNTPVS
ncbi:hypothetical protein C3489_06635 [Streptomyces sp. Ru71]|uniref:hypothetical protein n=1 Tax=Streptomyces sp. Ru71 TaxID=2080746 RepID=UPI000CDDF4ED|nr:hypothetical protein [Streptomyces sp. Ru71]POX56104.1 hypothetical protein C3489_06635 [Streptomyces sp. Ru71]